MQCFENAMMRDYLFALVREMEPAAARDDLCLDAMLEASGVEGMAALLALDADTVAGMARGLAQRLPLAA